MVYHYAPHGTVDGSEERFGFKSPNNDWVHVHRGAPEGDPT